MPNVRTDDSKTFASDWCLGGLAGAVANASGALTGVLIPLLAQRAGIANRGFENLACDWCLGGLACVVANASGTLTGVRSLCSRSGLVVQARKRKLSGIEELHLLEKSLCDEDYLRLI